MLHCFLTSFVSDPSIRSKFVAIGRSFLVPAQPPSRRFGLLAKGGVLFFGSSKLFRKTLEKYKETTSTHGHRKTCPWKTRCRSCLRWLSERVFTSLTGFNGCPQKDADGETWKVKVQLDEDCWEIFRLMKWFVFSVAKLHWLYSEIVYLFVVHLGNRDCAGVDLPDLWCCVHEDEYQCISVTCAFYYDIDLETLKEFRLLILFCILWDLFRPFESISTGWPCRNSSRIQCWGAWWHQGKLVQFAVRPRSGASSSQTSSWSFSGRLCWNTCPLYPNFISYIKKFSSYYDYGVLAWFIVIDDQFSWGLFRLSCLGCVGSIQRSCMLRTEICWVFFEVSSETARRSWGRGARWFDSHVDCLPRRAVKKGLPHERHFQACNWLEHHSSTTVYKVSLEAWAVLGSHKIKVPRKSNPTNILTMKKHIRAYKRLYRHLNRSL